MKNLFLVVGSLLLAVGCAGGPDAQLSSCQQDKDQLLATIKAQRDTTREATERAAALEARLDEAEKELARRSPNGTRLSSRPVETDSMPWRSPAEKASRAKPASRTAQSKSQSKASQSPKSSSGALAALVSQDERLQLDRETGTAQLDLGVQFESGTASLTATDRQQLDEVVKLLKSDDAADLRVMVSGFAAGKPSAVEGEAGGRIASPRQLAAARAQAVADYLDSHGIAGERLAVSGTGARAKGSAASEQPAGGVSLHLLPPDMPVVGWGTGDATLRR